MELPAVNRLVANGQLGSPSPFSFLLAVGVSTVVVLIVVLLLLKKWFRCPPPLGKSTKELQAVGPFPEESEGVRVSMETTEIPPETQCRGAVGFPRGPLPAPVVRRKQRALLQPQRTANAQFSLKSFQGKCSRSEPQSRRTPTASAATEASSALPLRADQLLNGQSPQFAPWAYLSWMGADNSLGSTAPTTPDPPYNFAGDSFVEDLINHYGGAGGGSKTGKVHVVCKGSVTNQVTNKKWCSGVFHGPGVAGHYRSASNPTEFSGDTGFSENILLQQHLDSSSAEGLRHFLQETSEAFPAQFRCLTLWGHAYAWCPDALLEDRQVLKGTQDPFFLAIEDDHFDTERPINSLRQAIEGSATIHSSSTSSSNPIPTDSGKINVLVFDTCMGMSLENLYLLRKATDILVGNCDYTGWIGVNHKAVGDVLRAGNPAGPGAGPITPWSLAKVIVDNFAPQLDGTMNFAIAAYQTSIAVTVREALGEVAFALVQYLQNNRLKATQEILAAAQSITIPSYTTGVGGNGGVDGLFADATRVMKQIRRNVQNSLVQEKCLLLEQLLLDSDGQYSYRHATDAFSGLACLNLFFPQQLSDYLETSSTPDATPYAAVYERLTFNSDPFVTDSGCGKCSWSAFLAEYFGVA